MSGSDIQGAEPEPASRVMSASLGLGTAQFGLDYGVTNHSGKLKTEEIRKVLHLALDAGVSLFDTAPAYGDAGALLGRLLPRRADTHIVTKTPAFGNVPTVTDSHAERLLTVFKTSLNELARSSAYGLMVHHSEIYFIPGADRIVDALQRLRADGMVEKLGVSIYSAKDIEQVIDLWIPCLSGYHPHPLYVVCLLGLQARAGAGALRRRSG